MTLGYCILLALTIASHFADWVKENEPDVLTYSVFTRLKAQDEILLFVRYKDGKALRSHNVAPEHQQVVYVNTVWI
jgi:quinol monooxygenase YgiN